MNRILWPLLPLVPVYGAVQAVNDAAYARGWRRIERLAWPVVSVGNLSAGGAGKTPFVIALAHALSARGWSVDVLSRGYRRGSHAVEQVGAEHVENPVQRYGDEPWLIAQEAGVPVFVGARRAAAGRLAEMSCVDVSEARHVHLLDDAMQHRGLARDANIVLLHRSDFRTTLLPAGRLREPLAALERADFLVLREEDSSLVDLARRWMRPGVQIWKIRRELELPAIPGAAVVFCAIAHPQDFVAEVRSKKVATAATEMWRDHHRFTGRDVSRLCERAANHGAACFLTTAKDAVRLSHMQRERLEEVAPVLVAKLTVRLLDAESALNALEERLMSRA